VTKRVLIVDDQADQLATLERGLRLLGFDCVAARGAEEALAEIQRDGARIDALLTDLTMPGRSGAALVERVAAMRPDLPILVLTGLVSSPEVLALRARGVPILRKPFTAEQLALQLLHPSRKEPS
jgi:CheY-like chemotaxis protein